MTVSELIEILQGYDGNRLVVISKDSEGNSYSPLSGTSAMKYKAKTTWYGEVGLEELTLLLRQQGYSEEDVIRDGERAVVLHPIN